MVSLVIGTLDFNNHAIAPTISVYRGEGLQTMCFVETLATSPVISFNDYLDPDPEEIKTALASISGQYWLDYEQLYKTNECESQFNNLAKGDSGKAHGLAQFWLSTFERNCPGMNYYSAKDQLHCQAQMWTRRQQNEWTCFSKFFKELKKFDFSKCKPNII